VTQTAEDDLALLRMPRQGQMAQEMDAPREPYWWEIAPPARFAVDGANRCAWCFDIFDRRRRPLAEVEALRRILMIEMTTPFDPPICNACFNAVVGSAVPPDQVSGEKPPMNPAGLSNLALHEWGKAQPAR
jgi:hypothetical protein